MAKLRLRRMDTLKLSEIEFSNTDWLWFPFLPLGNLTMLFGPGGHGKSTITLDIAARASRGLPFPGEDSDVTHEPINVLIMSAEDDPYEVLGPRYHKAGGDLERAFFSVEQLIISPTVIEAIKEMVKEYDIRLIVIDPVVSYFGAGMDMNKMNQVRTFVGALQSMSRELGISTIIVHHARKSQEGPSYDMAAGSSDFVNGVRSVIQIRTDNEGDYVFDHVKANLGPKHDPIKYTLEDGRVKWGITVTSGKPGSKKMNTGPSVKAARAYLLERLRTGPVAANDIMADAEVLGISSKAMNRAKPGIAESFAKRNEHDKLSWYWRLTEEGIKASGTSVPGVDERRPGDPANTAGRGLPRAMGQQAGSGASTLGAVVVATGPSEDDETERLAKQTVEQWLKQHTA